MATSTIDAIYLGNEVDLDTDETNNASELSGLLVGQTWGAQGAALADQIGSLTLNDPNDDGTTSDDESGFAPPEEIGFGGTSAPLDGTIAVNVTITYNDGSTATALMGFLQDTDGRLFAVPAGPNGSSLNDVLDDAPIRSLTVDSIANDAYDSIATNKEASAFVACFVSGTKIAVPGGERVVEEIQAGDLVATKDQGALPVIWRAQTQTIATGSARIVRIAKGALGAGLPRRGLKVSLQHRILLAGASDLVRAKALIALKGVSVIKDGRDAVFHHLLLPRNSIILGEGLSSESFFPGG